MCPQGISVVEQEQLDNMMIEMDGTENKCESKTRRDDPKTNLLVPAAQTLMKSKCFHHVSHNPRHKKTDGANRSLLLDR